MRPSVSATAHPGRTRAFSLRVPIATESERALFQRRLALTLLVVFALAFSFFLFQLLTVVLVLGGSAGAFLARPSVFVQLGTTFGSLAASLYMRRGKPSARVLGIAEVVATLGICVGWAFMIHVQTGLAASEKRIELVPLLAISYTLASRAALIPSTPVRSALVGLASMAPLVPITYFLRAGGSPDAGQAIGPAIYVGIWSGVGIACTTTISHVIYGLQLQVRKATHLGQYQLEDRIGEGGMGVVYRASHAMLRRPCAIKLLTGSTGHAAERFEREVQITARLTHPNTVVVFDYGRTPDGVFYYAMEYLDGITLEDMVEDFGPLPAPRVVHILAQVCGALQEAHANGLVHRDIKPANIMLTERGGVRDVVKVLDFGLVKQTEHSADPGVSDVGAILGTPHFMAPESIVAPSTVDGRTDLYALGATAYFMLTGQHVFDGTSLVEVCSQHLHQEPAPLTSRRADVPAALETVVLACLAKKPDDRPADAASLARLLAGCRLATWSCDDAAAWWAVPGPKVNVGAKTRARDRRAGGPSKPSFDGDTVAVALDGRGAA